MHPAPITHSRGSSTTLENVYDTERHLLYVACTRARDHLLVTGVEPASEFLDHLLGTHGPVSAGSL
jgi:ATP-dependent exoDNAse (exonuclease V) beta subunit